MNNDMVFFLAFAALVNLVILYIIINTATKASLRAKYEWAQMDLLAKIAMQQGVPAKEIEKTFEKAGLRQ